MSTETAEPIDGATGLAGVNEAVLGDEGMTSSNPSELAYERLMSTRTARPTGNVAAKAVLLHREDVDFLARHPTQFSNRSALGMDLRLPPLDYDGSEHARYRRLLDPLFAPKKVDAWIPDIARIANELIDTFIDRGECDFAREFAFPMPATMFLRLMGVPFDDLPRFRSEGEPSTAEERVQAAMDLNRRVYEYIDEALDDRKRERREDILSQLLDLELEGDRLSHDEVLRMTRLLFVAGLDTVNSALQCDFAYLASHPEHRRQLVETPAVIPSAVEELLRWASPVSGLSRVASEPVDVADVHLEPAERIGFSILAANNDPVEFDNPLTVDLQRNPNRHIAFGVGTHRCAGSHLARVELRIAVEEWHKRIPDYWTKPTTEPLYTNGIVRHVDLELAFPPGGVPTATG
jgi:cytochrome P450